MKGDAPVIVFDAPTPNARSVPDELRRYLEVFNLCRASGPRRRWGGLLARLQQAKHFPYKKHKAGAGAGGRVAAENNGRAALYRTW